MSGNVAARAQAANACIGKFASGSLPYSVALSHLERIFLEEPQSLPSWKGILEEQRRLQLDVGPSLENGFQSDGSQRANVTGIQSRTPADQRGFFGNETSVQPLLSPPCFGPSALPFRELPPLPGCQVLPSGTPRLPPDDVFLSQPIGPRNETGVSVSLDPNLFPFSSVLPTSSAHVASDQQTNSNIRKRRASTDLPHPTKQGRELEPIVAFFPMATQVSVSPIPRLREIFSEVAVKLQRDIAGWASRMQATTRDPKLPLAAYWLVHQNRYVPAACYGDAMHDEPADL